MWLASVRIGALPVDEVSGTAVYLLLVEDGANKVELALFGPALSRSESRATSGHDPDFDVAREMLSEERRRFGALSASRRDVDSTVRQGTS